LSKAAPLALFSSSSLALCGSSRAVGKVALMSSSLTRPFRSLVVPLWSSTISSPKSWTSSCSAFLAARLPDWTSNISLIATLFTNSWVETVSAKAGALARTAR